MLPLVASRGKLFRFQAACSTGVKNISTFYTRRLHSGRYSIPRNQDSSASIPTVSIWLVCAYWIYRINSENRYSHLPYIPILHNQYICTTQSLDRVALAKKYYLGSICGITRISCVPWSNVAPSISTPQSTIRKDPSNNQNS
ncbi:hypothetical protein GQ43DRAFT_438927 [Delitschia confertaspora ATCC 74209]|uniref:Uncharacterized protein n=1 Tax=Delitschia confertaspora ATCC 74209 TaxID=1513339 RepID=A0A9P4N0Y7_9PLEO|nr:hypothetical protein GQ43DRAFT_438927 [Delitschia confertaspora ATCC 74209]